MTDTNDDLKAETTPETPELPDEWKPEPREWTWKDVFTAPMLAFKPKCMFISLITVALLGLYAWGAWEMRLATMNLAVVGPVLLVGPCRGCRVVWTRRYTGLYFLQSRPLG